MCESKQVGKQFTLLELLVIIAIIGILLTILLPALTNVRELTRRAVCLSNQSQNCKFEAMYAKDNNSNFAAGFGVLPWDIGPNVIAKVWGNSSQSTQDVLNCPSNPELNIAHFWPYDSYRYVTGYMRVIRRDSGGLATDPLPDIGADKEWLIGLIQHDAPDEREMFADPVINDVNDESLWINFNYMKICSTAHSKYGVPAGGNAVYLDGHAKWRPWPSANLVKSYQNAGINFYW